MILLCKYYESFIIYVVIILFDVNTAIWLADMPGTTLIILDNLGWYCDVANDKFKYSHELIVIKIKESLNFVVKIKL